MLAAVRDVTSQGLILISNILAGFLSLVYFLVFFCLMPYHAVVVSKSKILMWIQIAVSCLFIGVILYYVLDIPEGENGAVIGEMLFYFPFLCFISQVTIFCTYWLFSKLINYLKKFTTHEA